MKIQIALLLALLGMLISTKPANATKYTATLELTAVTYKAQDEYKVGDKIPIVIEIKGLEELGGVKTDYVAPKIQDKSISVDLDSKLLSAVKWTKEYLTSSYTASPNIGSMGNPTISSGTNIPSGTIHQNQDLAFTDPTLTVNTIIQIKKDALPEVSNSEDINVNLLLQGAFRRQEGVQDYRGNVGVVNHSSNNNVWHITGKVKDLKPCSDQCPSYSLSKSLNGNTVEAPKAITETSPTPQQSQPTPEDAKPATSNDGDAGIEELKESMNSNNKDTSLIPAPTSQVETKKQEKSTSEAPATGGSTNPSEVKKTQEKTETKSDKTEKNSGSGIGGLIVILGGLGIVGFGGFSLVKMIVNKIKK